MGRSGICINFNVIEQMWIDKGKIDTLKTFIRQPLSKPIKNASILLQFITKLVDMFNPFQIFIYIYTIKTAKTRANILYVLVIR